MKFYILSTRIAFSVQRSTHLIRSHASTNILIVGIQLAVFHYKKADERLGYFSDYTNMHWASIRRQTTCYIVDVSLSHTHVHTKVYRCTHNKIKHDLCLQKEYTIDWIQGEVSRLMWDLDSVN